MQASKTIKIPPTHQVQRDINGEKFTLNGIKPKDLKEFLTSGAKIQFVDCQSGFDNVGKEFRGALHMDIPGAGWAKIKFDALVEKVPATFDKLAAADVVVFYCSHANVRSPATMHAYQKAMIARPRAGSNPNQHVLLLSDGINGYMEIKGAPGIKDYTVPSMGKVLAWAKLDKVGTKIEVTKPSFQQVPQPGTIQPEPVYLYTEQ